MSAIPSDGNGVVSDASSIRAARRGLLAGLACYLPVVCWSAPQLEAGSATFGLGLRALWIAQAILIVLLLPRSVGSTPGRGAAGLFLLITAPAPLLSVCWLSGAADGKTLAVGVVMLMGLGGAVLALAHGLSRLPLGRSGREAAAGATQLALAAALWASRGEWLHWTGL